MWKAIKYFVLVFAAFCVLAALPVLYIIPARMDPQGYSGGGCFSEAITPSSNEDGIVVSEHHTYCDDIFHDSAIYVYLRNPGESENSNSLIFRYADEPDSLPPRISWIGRQSLLISVGDVVQITKIIPSLDGVQINYNIGQEKIARSVWYDHIHFLKIIEVGLSLFIILMSTTFIIVFLSLRR